MQEQHPREGGSGREKHGEETDIVAASLRGFQEGTMPFRAMPRAGSRTGGSARRSHHAMQTSPQKKEPLPLMSVGEHHIPASKAAGLWRRSCTPRLRLSWGQGVLLLLVSPQVLPHWDRGLQDLGLCHWSDPSHPSIQRWRGLLSCRRSQPRKRFRYG